MCALVDASATRRGGKGSPGKDSCCATQPWELSKCRAFPGCAARNQTEEFLDQDPSYTNVALSSIDSLLAHVSDPGSTQPSLPEGEFQDPETTGIGVRPVRAT